MTQASRSRRRSDNSQFMNQIDRLHLGTAGSLDKLYHRLHRLFPQALWAGNPERHEIALTFDDGPNPRDTLSLLEVLARHQATATFFQHREPG